MSNLAAYLHIPFCQQKCRYCDFFSVSSDELTRKNFSAALAEQIRNSPAKGETLSSVYFGGGTPSLLSPEAFCLIFSALRDTFSLIKECEITVECNPESVNNTLLAGLADCGVNRLSMGIQTFSSRLLQVLGRIHSAEEGINAFYRMRQFGFRNINLDLITALPGMTQDEAYDDLETIAELAPEHISVYLLKIEPNTPLGREGAKEQPEEEQEAYYLQADRFFSTCGYEHYEISNFAKPGYRSMHNCAYWNGTEYLAFGPGAAGYYKNLRYRIPADLKGYLWAKGNVAPVVEQYLDDREKAKEKILLSLRTLNGLKKQSLRPETLALFDTLKKNGLTNCVEDHYFLTPRGFLLSNAIIQQVLDSERY